MVSCLFKKDNLNQEGVVMGLRHWSGQSKESRGLLREQRW